MLSFSQFIQEGNPVGRLHRLLAAGTHAVALSATRPNYSDAENKQRNKSMEQRIQGMGYGTNKTAGMWEGGEEHSLMVHAKGPGQEHGDQLLHDMKTIAAEHDQDSILHMDDKGGTLHGTNETGYPGKDKTDVTGPLRPYTHNPHGMAAYGRSKPPAKRAFFTTKQRD